MADSDVVLRERHGAVLSLTLNRPDKLNAWNAELEHRYFEELAAADADPAIRVIVITGAGRGFCAGADMAALGELEESDTARQQLLERSVEFPLSIRKPLIAAVNGAVAGLGLAQALFCDLRFTTAEAKFTTSFARRGLVAEYGMAWLLPRLIGRGAATELLLSGRVLLGDEAARIGLADRVFAPERLLPETLEYARELAEHCSPASMRTIKQQLASAATASFETALEDSKRLMAESLAGPDFTEGLRAYLDGRAPEFPPLPER